MVRTRFAPSPTGYMHIGGLRTALYEYLTAKSNNGTFILRIEDTDQERFVDGAIEIIYKTLKIAGINHDEGPDIGGDYGPYTQSERKGGYMKYALELVDKKKAYYCFCTKERLAELDEHQKYDRCCLNLSDEEIQQKLKDGVPYVIRQKMNDVGTTTFVDEVFGSITVENSGLEDQVLIKSDGLPTYNFANVVDDHLMKITHVVRGSEYLPSTPKYNQLYEAFGWEIPIYIHLTLILSENGGKLSKRKGDATFDDLLALGYLPEAVLNYVALLGWSPGDTREFFTIQELAENFNIKGLSKSPSTLDMKKLTWMNGEYLKKLDPNKFYELALPHLKEAIKRTDIDLKKVAELVQSRVELPKQVTELVDFIDVLPEYSAELYVHKKMKTTEENSLASLEKALPLLENLTDWNEHTIHDLLLKTVEEMGIKNGQMLWPIRTALSGKPTSPCGATELAELLGKADSIERIKKGIQMLKK